VTDEELVVARIVGDELHVERYRLQQRAESTLTFGDGELEGMVRRLRPDLVLWTAPDARGRVLAEALREGDARAEWRPGCIEVPGWTELPLSELMSMVCRVEDTEAPEQVEGSPAQLEGAPAGGPSELEHPEPSEAPEPTGEEPAATQEPTPADLGDRLELVLAARAKRREEHGTASGGAASGGAASGGAASGGAASGGAASGGTASGGTASGGTASGGAVD